MQDLVNSPRHYTNHPSKIECVDIVDKFNFCLGNAFKYLYRCNNKNNTILDLQKADYYLTRELFRRAGNWEWFANSADYLSCADGCPEIQALLVAETRYRGHMKAALGRIYEAHVYRRGTEALKSAMASVDVMIKMQNR